jgi:hypothetical protein
MRYLKPNALGKRLIDIRPFRISACKWDVGIPALYLVHSSLDLMTVFFCIQKVISELAQCCKVQLTYLWRDV